MERTEISRPRSGVRWRLALALPRAASTIVNHLLDEEPLADATICEASVHLPRRSSVWVATFTGPSGGRIWKSTGMTDREQALALAKHWEAEARAQRVSLGRPLRKTILRVSGEKPGTGLLTQRQVAQLLNMSERGVREVERRAFQKLRQHPLLREVWQQYLIGELDEHQPILTSEEIQALFAVAHTPEERDLIRKVLRLIER